MGSFLHVYDGHLLPSLCLSRPPNVMFIRLTEQVHADRSGGSPIVLKDTYFYSTCFSCISFHLHNVSADIVYSYLLPILGEV